MNDNNSTRNTKNDKNARSKLDEILEYSEFNQNEINHQKKVITSPKIKNINIATNNINKGITVSNTQIVNNYAPNKSPKMFNNSPIINEKTKCKNNLNFSNSKEKSKDLFTNNLNNIFNSFSNSSLIGNVNNKQQNVEKIKKTESLIENNKSNEKII